MPFLGDLNDVFHVCSAKSKFLNLVHKTALPPHPHTSKQHPPHANVPLSCMPPTAPPLPASALACCPAFARALSSLSAPSLQLNLLNLCTFNSIPTFFSSLICIQACQSLELFADVGEYTSLSTQPITSVQYQFRHTSVILKVQFQTTTRKRMFQFVKNTSVTCNKAKYTKTKYAYIAKARPLPGTQLRATE